jgi:succinate dehydrogenase / fumarate reductase membrane anchor subunit
MTSSRTGLSRARGLGSAKHGVGQFIAERVTAIALVPLVLWAVYAGINLSLSGYAETVAWLHQPVNAILMVLLIVAAFWHMHLGMRVIVEDYIHGHFAKMVLLLLNLFVYLLGAAVAVIGVLKVAFMSGAV